LVDLILLAAIAFLWVKLNRPQKDDPRMSRGLQLLQSKIAVLEDLSDQVETQVQQITALIEAKAKEVQNQIHASEKQLQKIEASMGKSLEVAKIFQDRIPHQEIIERQNTMKYVKAARLAHQGVSLEEITEQVDLTRGEIELIAKVNRDNLQFSEDDLPEWAKKENSSIITETVLENFVSAPLSAAAALEGQLLARLEDRAPHSSLSNLGEKFRASNHVIQDSGFVPTRATARTTPAPIQAHARPAIEMPGGGVAPPAAVKKIMVKETATTSTGKTVQIQKVVFPRLDLNDELG
jgi:vacuolar-type H+-ATPase subunit I/STV1